MVLSANLSSLNTFIINDLNCLENETAVLTKFYKNNVEILNSIKFLSESIINAESYLKNAESSQLLLNEDTHKMIKNLLLGIYIFITSFDIYLLFTNKKARNSKALILVILNSTSLVIKFLSKNNDKLKVYLVLIQVLAQKVSQNLSINLKCKQEAAPMTSMASCKGLRLFSWSCMSNKFFKFFPKIRN